MKLPRHSDRIIGEHLAYMRAAGRSARTIHNRKLILGRLDAFLGKPLIRATGTDLAVWAQSLDMLPESARIYISHVRAFYAWAVDYEKIRRSPARHLPMPRKPRRLPRPIPETELARAIAAADRRLRLMLVLSSCAGLRAAEIANLRWRSIYADSANPFMVVPGKGNRERSIPLSPFLLAELDRYGRRPRGYVFGRMDGKPGPNQPWRVSQLIGAHYRSLGIAASSHNGRHRFATVALETCHDVRQVQELLGHASLSTTQIYTQVNPELAAATVASMPVPVERKLNAVLYGRHRRSKPLDDRCLRVALRDRGRRFRAYGCLVGRPSPASARCRSRTDRGELGCGSPACNSYRSLITWCARPTSARTLASSAYIARRCRHAEITSAGMPQITQATRLPPAPQVPEPNRISITVFTGAYSAPVP